MLCFIALPVLWFAVGFWLYISLRIFIVTLAVTSIGYLAIWFCWSFSFFGCTKTLFCYSMLPLFVYIHIILYYYIIIYYFICYYIYYYIYLIIFTRRSWKKRETLSSKFIYTYIYIYIYIYIGIRENVSVHSVWK